MTTCRAPFGPLVAFMVTCIHFLKNLLLWVFTNILVRIESKVLLSVAMMLVSAVLAAFLDALSVAAVIAIGRRVI